MDTKTPNPGQTLLLSKVEGLVKKSFNLYTVFWVVGSKKQALISPEDVIPQPLYFTIFGLLMPQKSKAFCLKTRSLEHLYAGQPVVIWMALPAIKRHESLDGSLAMPAQVRLTIHNSLM
jgi:hypothetical protein